LLSTDFPMRQRCLTQARVRGRANC
jgi:hypothetical protein